MILLCDICGKQGHPWFDCPQRKTKPEGWKPDRLKVGAMSAVTPGNNRPAERPQGPDKSTAVGKDRLTSQRKSAPREASAVGGKSKADADSSMSLEPPGGIPEGSERNALRSQAGTQAPPVDTKSKGGRPRIHPDRKAYKAQMERERRVRLKANEKPRQQ